MDSVVGQICLYLMEARWPYHWGFGGVAGNELPTVEMRGFNALGAWAHGVVGAVLVAWVVRATFCIYEMQLLLRALILLFIRHF